MFLGMLQSFSLPDKTAVRWTNSTEPIQIKYRTIDKLGFRPFNQEKIRVKLMGAAPRAHRWRYKRVRARISKTPESFRRLGHDCWSFSSRAPGCLG
ncbi:MAG TPA: hypothetical protein DD662_08715 [Planctomycetaceae bacterium]|nr:hypothetical protein [Planctomycetaceae bacterium]